MMKLNKPRWVALILLLIGGLNWGLVGIFNFNLVSAIFGDMSAISRIIYIVVGLSALYLLSALQVRQGAGQGSTSSGKVNTSTDQSFKNDDNIPPV